MQESKLLLGVGNYRISEMATDPDTIPTEDYEFTITKGQDLTLTWTTSTDPSARVRLTYNANNRGHGAPYDAIITCEVADADGTLTVPAAMMDTFPATTAWRICAGRDCPPSTLRRFHHVATPALAGEVGLTVASEYYFFVDHPGP